MQAYVLLEDDGHERPWQIFRADGSPVFTMTRSDRTFAESVLNALNTGTSLSPEDTDELADAA